MVKLTCVAILKYNGPDREPYILGMEADLSTFGYFQRSTVKEMLTFVARTVARKTQVGQRQTVQQEEYFCHVHNRDGLVGVAFCDKEYPVRAGFCVVGKILDDYRAVKGEGWRGTKADSTDAQDILEPALTKYQVSVDQRELARRSFSGKKRTVCLIFGICWQARLVLHY
jgi:synaptobrevin homolog YKT6